MIASPPQNRRLSRIARARARYARNVAAQGGEAFRGPLEAAFRRVPRELFLGPPPWFAVTDGGYVAVPRDDPVRVYQDALFALDRAKGINNGEPTLHARMLAALNPHLGDHVAHIGAGTGYYSAILAELVGPQGRVVGYEIEPELAARARTYLAGWSNIEVRSQSAAGVKLPAVDGIYVNAGATRPEPCWLDALKEEGGLVFPLVTADGWGVMLKARKRGDAFDVDLINRVRFIPCTGVSDEAEGEAVARAFRSGELFDARSLHRGNAHDSSCVLTGKGWWLSNRPVQ